MSHVSARWTAALALALCAFAPAARAAAGAGAPNSNVGANFDFRPIADGVYAVIRRDPPGLMCDGNCVVIVNDDDVVVVDAPESSREVIAAIQKLTKKPVRIVVNTHWHDDHVTGNAAYRAAWPGVEFVGHERTLDYLPGPGLEARRQMLEGAPQGENMLRELLALNRDSAGDTLDDEQRASYRSDIALVEQYLRVVPRTEYIPPTLAVHDRLTLRRGRRLIEVLALGEGHTAGDLVVWLPKERIAVAGDLVVWPVPLVGAEQSHVGEWSAALDSLCALGPVAIVPGHGPVLTDTTYVRSMAALFRSITAQVRAAVARGETLEQVRKAVDLAEFRKQFAGASRVRNALFSDYVEGPGVAAAFREAHEKP